MMYMYIVGGFASISLVAGVIIYKKSSSVAVGSHKSDRHSQIPTSSSTSSQTNSNFQNKNKITYNINDEIRLFSGNSSIYKGKFEASIDVAVKKVDIRGNDTTQIKSDLCSLEERLRRVVDINHDILKEGSVSNIVKFFCYEFEKGSDRTYLLLALELCDDNLEEYVRNRPNFPQISDNEIIYQIVFGLQYLHSRQIVHRDLKPSNILVKKIKNGDNDTLLFKLSDFGLSKLNTQTQNGFPTEFSALSNEFGTELWIPPEIFALRYQQTPDIEKSYWKRSDIFSLGLIFYFIVSRGMYVFQSQDDIQNEKADFNHVSRNKPLLDLLRHMLKPKPKERPFTEYIMKHPALWGEEKTLNFFDNTSNLLMDQSISTSPMCTIENNAVNILRGTWIKHLTQSVEDCLFPFVPSGHRHLRGNQKQPFYDVTSVKSLLRAIRNNRGHYYQLKSAVQIEFGTYPDGFLQYWTSRFPDLLMHTYDAMKNYRLEPSMRTFYE